MFPVVVSDLDGTLFNPNHQLSPKTQQVIKALGEQGVKFILATGRHYEDIKHLRTTLGLDMYLVTSNGARAHSPDDKPVVQIDISPDIVKPLLALRHEVDIPVLTNVFQEGEWLIDNDAQWLLNAHKDSGFFYQIRDMDKISEENIQKVTFIAESGAVLDPLYEKVETLLGDRVSLTSSSPSAFEVMQKGVTKASTLKEVLKLKGYELKDAMAFGDGMNDLQMLSQVGKGVVMGNADAKLVALLPDNEQIGFSHDDAVADYLKKHYINSQEGLISV